ncbi:MAG: hypothetical protein DCC65_17885 [Planctomycetota bacterium]|nr:MAG: hypothetical protein DCC65_17885 [Planctomycetota bacterium]
MVAQTARVLILISFAMFARCAGPHGGPVPVEGVSGVKNLKRDGQIYVAGTPTSEGLDQLKDRGVMTVIDLRRQDEIKPEEVQAARDRGMTYVNIPMKSDEMTREQLDAFMEIMRAHSGEPVLVHCAGGSRAGGMYGAYLGKSGQCPADEALRRAKEAGLRNPELEKDLSQALNEEDAVKPLGQ